MAFHAPGRILVSGGGSGIGAAIAQRLAGDGAEAVLILDRSAEAAEAVSAEVDALGSRGISLVADIRDEDAVAAVLADGVARAGGLDGAVLSAAIQLIGEDAPIDVLPIEVLRRTLEVNVVGTAIVAKHVAAALLAAGAGGSIVVIGSPTGLVGQPPDTAYGTSKAATHGLARVMAAELAPAGIRVNVVVPGYTETPLTRVLREDPQRSAAIVAGIPLGRAGQPEDVAGITTFLLSADASYATGAIFTVDGGMTAI